MWTWCLEVQESSCIRRKVICQRWLSRKIKGSRSWITLVSSGANLGGPASGFLVAWERHPLPTVCQSHRTGVSQVGNWKQLIKRGEHQNQMPFTPWDGPWPWNKSSSLWSILDSSCLTQPMSANSVLPFFGTNAEFSHFIRSITSQSKPTSFLTWTTAMTSWKTSLLLPFPFYNLPSTYTLSL